MRYGKISAALTLVLAHAVMAVQLKTLATFTNTNGEEPYSGLVADPSGNLYGTTLAGTFNSFGDTFEISPSSGTMTTTNFVGTFAEPQNPYGKLLSDGLGNFYGASAGGGTNAKGTIYLFNPSAGTNTIVATFNGTQGAAPYGDLLSDSSGNLYGTAIQGGAFGVSSGGYGTIYKVAAGTHALSAFASFNGTNGSSPYSNLIADSSGNLYGTTADGGAHGVGVVFESDHATGAITDLASFNSTNGAYPTGGLIVGTDGNWYGTTDGDGVTQGTLFQVNKTTHVLTAVVIFNGTNGADPYASLIADSSGNLYGTTVDGGANGDGTVFEFNPNTLVLTTLYSFNGTDGMNPYGSLMLDASGNLYGTTTFGGADNDGTAFELIVPEPATFGMFLPFAYSALLRRRSGRG